MSIGPIEIIRSIDVEKTEPVGIKTLNFMLRNAVYGHVVEES
jgi:hypothetical protein